MFTNKHNKAVRHSFYPQFPEGLSTKMNIDPTIDEHTAECKWLGETMDIHHFINPIQP